MIFAAIILSKPQPDEKAEFPVGSHGSFTEL
jgi:hypothetical protein